MAKTKKEKQEILEEIKKDLENQQALVFINYSGLKADDIFDLREELKEAGCSLKVVKKTLAKMAFKEKGLEIKDENLEGQLAVIFGFEDPVMPAKIPYNLSKENENLEILGGFLEKEYKGPEEIITLARIPSKDELLAKVVGSISAPISNFVRVLQGNSRSLVYALTAIKNSKS